MKQLTIVNDVAAGADVRALLEKAGVAAWTRIPRCAGRGPRTGAREDDHVWPGYNETTVAILDDTSAVRAMDALRALRESHPRAGLFAWTADVSDWLR